MRTRQKGMTLMELLTVVTIVGILASVAVPSYRRYLIRSQRSDATTALLRLQSAQEKYFLQNGTYVVVTADIPNATNAGGLGLATTSERGFYDLAVEDTDTGYTATATPAAGGGQSDDNVCVVFSITEAGARRAEDAGGGDRTTECFR